MHHVLKRIALTLVLDGLVQSPSVGDQCDILATVVSHSHLEKEAAVIYRVVGQSQKVSLLHGKGLLFGQVASTFGVLAIETPCGLFRRALPGQCG